MMIESVRTAILGAGISGLATGFYLKKSFPQSEIQIFEKESRVGGIIDTLHHQGHLFELGARGLRPKGKGEIALEFIREIGLWDQMVCANQKSRGRYLYLNGQLRKMPPPPLKALFSPIAISILSSVYKDLCVKPKVLNYIKNGREESVASFLDRHCRKDLKEALFDPFISGICAGDIEKLSMDALFPVLAQMERRHGSLLKAWLKRPKQKENGFEPSLTHAGIISFRNGMSQLVAKTAEHLSQNLRISCEINRVESHGKSYRIYFSKDSVEHLYEADIVISTLPAAILANLVMGFDKKIVDTLKEIEYAPVAIVPLAFRERVNPCKGFGYLIPQKENQDILGAYWNDQTFPEFHRNAGSSFTVLMGGMRFKDFHSKDGSFFIEKAVENLKRHLKIKQEPEFQTVKILPKALPQYTLGHLKRMEIIKKYSPVNFYIRGNFMGGFGIGDILRNAKETVGEIGHADG